MLSQQQGCSLPHPDPAFHNCRCTCKCCLKAARSFPSSPTNADIHIHHSLHILRKQHLHDLGDASHSLLPSISHTLLSLPVTLFPSSYRRSTLTFTRRLRGQLDASCAFNNMSSPSETVFNHLVLPPQLPGRQDTCHDDLTQTFIALLDNSIGFLAELAPHAYKDTLTALRNTLSVCSKLNRGRLDRTSLVDAFNKIEQHPLILHMADQNAALIIRFEKV